MKNYSDDMDQNWQRRLERQRMQDAIDEADRDRTERRVMLAIRAVALLIFLIIVAGVVFALRVSKEVSVSSRGGLTIIVWAPPASTPKGDILPLTEPLTLRTVQNHPPSARPVKPGPRQFRAIAIRQAGRCRVPVALALRLVGRESSWNPLARSYAGAAGLAQVLPYHSGPLLDVWDPETNLSLGFCLLRRHFDRLKGWNLDDARAWRMALQAYHGGQYRVRTAAITRRYVADILGSAQ